MPLTEYFEPHLLHGERDYPDIGIEADKIYGLLLRAKPMMNKEHRQCYHSLAVQHIERIIAAFNLAYEVPSRRETYLEELWAEIAVFIRLMRHVGEINAICIRPKYETMSPDTLKLELMGHIGRMDEGATRWRNSLKGRHKGTRARSASMDGTDSLPRDKGCPTP